MYVFLGGLHGEGGGGLTYSTRGVWLETRLDNHHRRLAQRSSLQKGMLGGIEDVKRGHARGGFFFWGGGGGRVMGKRKISLCSGGFLGSRIVDISIQHV